MKFYLASTIAVKLLWIRCPYHDTASVMFSDIFKEINPLFLKVFYKRVFLFFCYFFRFYFLYFHNRFLRLSCWLLSWLSCWRCWLYWSAASLHSVHFNIVFAFSILPNIRRHSVHVNFITNYYIQNT